MINPTISIITPSDKIFSDCSSILLVNPGTDLLVELQQNFLSQIEDDINIFHYNKETCMSSDIDWLLSVFHISNVCIVDIDNVDAELRLLLSYFISKPKTYWLTNDTNSIFKHISKKQVYNLDFLNGD